MLRFAALIASILIMAGCTSTGALVQGPDLQLRAAQDLGCALILANQGVKIAAGVTAADALALISAASSQPQVASVCGATASNIAADIAGAHAAAAAKNGAPVVTVVPAPAALVAPVVK